MTDQPDTESTDTPLINIDLSDPDLKKRVSECIEKNGRLKVFMTPKGSEHPRDGNGYTRLD